MKDDLRGFESLPWDVCVTHAPLLISFPSTAQDTLLKLYDPKLVDPDQHTQQPFFPPTACFAELSDLSPRVYTEQILISAKLCWDAEGSRIV